MAEIVLIVLLLSFLFQVLILGHGQLIDSGVSKRAEKLIIREINGLRDNVNRGKEEPNLPTALFLKKLTYSEEMSEALQEHINTCDVTSPPFFYGGKKTGSIVFLHYSSSDNAESEWGSIVENWLAKRKVFLYGHKNFTKAGNFQHIVNDRAKKFGCAYAYCETTAKKKMPYTKIYECAFDAIAGRKPYEKAED